MDQKTQLKIEFFELCRLLNKSNLKINQKTNISFFIHKNNQKMTLYATTNHHYKIQLISCEKKNVWTTCNYSGCNHLESELVDLFRKQRIAEISATELTKMIKLFIFQHIS